MNELLAKPTDSQQVIVTGATGFVGRHLVPLLARNGYDVVAMSRNEGKARNLSGFAGIPFVSMDLGQPLRGFVPRPGAILIHLAWPGLPNYRALLHLEENLPHSYAFIKQMVEMGVGQVLVTGTCLEYGMQSGELTSMHETHPSNSYAFAKDALRRQLGFLGQDVTFKLQWARLFYMYGAGQNPRSILAQLDAAIDRGDASFDMSAGEQLRDYLPVEAVAHRLCAIVHSGTAGIFNVCSGTPISVRRLVERHIENRGASIAMNLGHYSYPDYESLAFWGKPDLT
jgi:dTDP-6-deoxy-L-talose 4-dehydrogenase (NAD+)